LRRPIGVDIHARAAQVDGLLAGADADRLGKSGTNTGAARSPQASIPTTVTRILAFISRFPAWTRRLPRHSQN